MEPSTRRTGSGGPACTATRNRFCCSALTTSLCGGRRHEGAPLGEGTICSSRCGYGGGNPCCRSFDHLAAMILHVRPFCPFFFVVELAKGRRSGCHAPCAPTQRVRKGLCCGRTCSGPSFVSTDTSNPRSPAAQRFPNFGEAPRVFESHVCQTSDRRAASLGISC